MRRILVCTFIAWGFYAAPAAAQTIASLPVTCNPSGTNCVQAQPVTNPDGSLIGSAAVSPAPRAIVAPTDGSGTLTAGGTSQQVFAANAARIYLNCQNPVAASETLFINVGATASTTGGSFELGPGGTFSPPPGVTFTGTVSVNAATTGHRFICKQG